jgi:hypothetical protein
VTDPIDIAPHIRTRRRSELTPEEQQFDAVVLTLRALPLSVLISALAAALETDDLAAVAAALKRLGRRFGLQAIEIRQASVHRCASGAARLPLWLIACQKLAISIRFIRRVPAKEFYLKFDSQKIQ